MGTIKVPRNLGMITDRLPKSQYLSRDKGLSRNASLPEITEERSSPVNKHGLDIKKRGGSLAPI